MTCQRHPSNTTRAHEHKQLFVCCVQCSTLGAGGKPSTWSPPGKTHRAHHQHILATSNMTNLGHSLLQRERGCEALSSTKKIWHLILVLILRLWDSETLRLWDLWDSEPLRFWDSLRLQDSEILWLKLWDSWTLWDSKILRFYDSETSEHLKF